MAYIGMAYVVMANIHMAYVGTAYIVMAYTVMAYTVMALYRLWPVQVDDWITEQFRDAASLEDKMVRMKKKENGPQLFRP